MKSTLRLFLMKLRSNDVDHLHDALEMIWQARASQGEPGQKLFRDLAERQKEIALLMLPGLALLAQDGLAMFRLLKDAIFFKRARTAGDQPLVVINVDLIRRGFERQRMTNRFWPSGLAG